MATLTSVCLVMQQAAAGVTGINFAPDYPPESASDFPFVATMPNTLTLRLNTTEDFRTLWSITQELHMAQQDLPVDAELLIAYAESIPNAVIKALKAASIAFDYADGSFGALKWGAIPTRGFQWTYHDVKILTTIT